MQFLLNAATLLTLAGFTLAVPQPVDHDPKSWANGGCGFKYDITQTLQMAAIVTSYNAIIPTTTEIDCKGCQLMVNTVTATQWAKGFKEGQTQKYVLAKKPSTTSIPVCKPTPNRCQYKHTTVVTVSQALAVTVPGLMVAVDTMVPCNGCDLAIVTQTVYDNDDSVPPGWKTSTITAWKYTSTIHIPKCAHTKPPRV
ncbi:hypothetical protein TWF694_003497 [Orbilia ellipsospora]|uniref:Uncharacterized protein n=1 Tax=Orbilia ellipsospora TaxID=2528407 RepID=A0AAV9WZE5_9PEZI